MERYLIIADDFTGANDTGVQLTRRGITTKVVFESHAVKEDDCSYVLDTQSRGMSSEEAYQRVKTDSESIDLSAFDYIIKKVDSTLRGNVAHEIKALDEVYKSDCIIFMPAFPDIGRVTEDGIHYLNGTRLMETEFARDPKNAVREDSLIEILKEVYQEPVTPLPVQDIRKGRIDLGAGRIFAADAMLNEDMHLVVKQAVSLGKKILWVGSAAIADHLLDRQVVTKPAAALIASVSEVSRSQVKYAEQAGVALVSVPVYEVLNGRELKEYASKAVDVLKSGKDVMILSSATYDREELTKTIAVGGELGISPEETAVKTQKLMGELAEMVLSKAAVSGLFLTGGDTATGFFHQVGSNGSLIMGEAAVGIPIMRLEGGRFDGLKVITKAGAFGNQEAITYGLRKLKEI